MSLRLVFVYLFVYFKSDYLFISSFHLFLLTNLFLLVLPTCYLFKQFLVLLSSISFLVIPGKHYHFCINTYTLCCKS